MTAMDLNESEVNIYYSCSLTSVFAYPLWKMRHMLVNVSISFLQWTSIGIVLFRSRSCLLMKSQFSACSVRPTRTTCASVQVEEFALQLGKQMCV